MKVNIKVPATQTVVFNAILAKLNISNKLTATIGDDLTFVTYEGELTDDEAKKLKETIGTFGMDSIIKVTIGALGKVANKIINVAAKDLAVPVVTESAKVVAETGKNIAVASVKIGTSLFNTSVTSVTSAKKEIADSAEWKESKQTLGSWWAKGKTFFTDGIEFS